LKIPFPNVTSVKFRTYIAERTAAFVDVQYTHGALLHVSLVVCHSEANTPGSLNVSWYPVIGPAQTLTWFVNVLGNVLNIFFVLMTILFALFNELMFKLAPVLFASIRG